MFKNCNFYIKGTLQQIDKKLKATFKKVNKIRGYIKRKKVRHLKKLRHIKVGVVANSEHVL